MSYTRLAKVKMETAQVLLAGAKKELGLLKTDREKKARIEHLERDVRKIKYILKKPAVVEFSIGCGATNTYIVKRGNWYECMDFYDGLPSVNDDGWHDAWEGTNPFREACEVI